MGGKGTNMMALYLQAAKNERSDDDDLFFLKP